MKFQHHTYKWTRPFGWARHAWSLVGPNGAISFHASANPDAPVSCGLEYHHLADPYGKDNAPDHLNCAYTGGRCWHDGSSLYATETLWPEIQPLLARGDHGSVFAMLEHEYCKRFEK